MGRETADFVCGYLAAAASRVVSARNRVARARYGAITTHDRLLLHNKGKYSAIAHPTIRRLHTSSTTATYKVSPHVGMYVMSATQS
jgi:hypothetical protein